jgi:hypothetical protein
MISDSQLGRPDLVSDTAPTRATNVLVGLLGIIFPHVQVYLKKS